MLLVDTTDSLMNGEFHVMSHGYMEPLTAQETKIFWSPNVKSEGYLFEYVLTQP